MSDMVTTGQTALNEKPHDDDAEARDVTGGNLRGIVVSCVAFLPVGRCIPILYIERNT